MQVFRQLYLSNMQIIFTDRQRVTKMTTPYLHRRRWSVAYKIK